MAVDDYDNHNSNHMHHLRKDVNEAHTTAQVAKMLATLALLGMVIALALSVWALDKAGEAQSTANRSMEISQRAE